MNPLAVALWSVIAGSLFLRGWLTLRQVRCLQANQMTDLRSVQFGVARTVAEFAYAAGDALLIAVLVLTGGVAAIERLWNSTAVPPAVAGAAIILSALGVRGALRLVCSAHRVFVVDQRFGLNRRSALRFASDASKRLVAVTAEVMPTIALTVWALHRGEGGYLVAAWASWFTFVLFRTWLGPVVFRPLLVRHAPLDAPVLAERLEALGRRAGLPATTLVECSSSLSSRANAAARGFGRMRRVIVTDTLLDLLAEDEIEAVVAHELGHLAHHHMAFYLAAIGAAGLAVFGALAYLSGHPHVVAGLDIRTGAGMAAALLMILPSVGFFLRAPAAAALRRIEYQADAFARRHADGGALARALDKLYSANGTSAVSDPIYAAVFSSHPGPSERRRRLLANAELF